MISSDNDDKPINSQDILNAIDLNKINMVDKKKRGRPKKTHQLIYTTPKIKLQSSNDSDLEEEEIILHLPISKSELNTINSSTYSINDIVDKQVEEGIDEDEEDCIETSVNEGYVKQLRLIIKKLKDENDELKKYLTDITPMYFTEVKLYPVNLKLFDIKNGSFIPTKTNICCWWCTYNFDWLPTYLPEKYSDGKFYVRGCFCTFNCKAAYNLNLGDEKVWSRYSLIKMMYYLINKDKIKSMNDIEINIAGPKELLEKYGGPMTIEEYRKNSKILGREYHEKMPPFLPLSYAFEEITNSKTNKNMSSFISSGLKNDSIVSKRNKPVNNIASKHIDSFFVE